MSNTQQEQRAVELRQLGMSYANIVKATGLPERKVKALTKGIVKVSPINTPLAKAVERVYTLAKRPHGIRDYELRDIMHEEYGSKWDTENGKYISSYSQNDIKYVREKVRIRAAQDDCNVLFTPDWIDELAPTAGREFLEAAANDLMTGFHAYKHQYMELHATRWREDSEEADLAQRKQMYAVEQHLFKLAVKGFGNEPLERLLERSLVLTDLMEGTPDAVMASVKGGNSIGEALEYYAEPRGTNPFLDFVESQGWLKEVEDRFI